MRQPQQNETWILNNERFDPETGIAMSPINLFVRVERIDEAHVRKGVSQTTGKPYEISVPDRIHFRYRADETNIGLGLQDEESGLMKVGSYELSLFMERAKPA